MPFIISISGAEKIGVSVACQRLYHALRHTHTVKIVEMKTRNNVMAFEDDLLTDEHKDFDVLIIDKHPYISSALHRNLRSSLFDDDSVKPDISFVMVCRFDTYKQRRPQAKVSYNLLDSYATSAPKYFGTDNHHRIACDGADGQLACAGKIIAKVRKELIRCK
ncbi:MAG TPA: hypothetical protein DIS69_00790 [Moraxellaceae bacterium]|nr:hypothetical protein [Moraxella sp.]HCN14591.1 hypothetical protein [Moraxellaceae bacterium]